MNPLPLPLAFLVLTQVAPPAVFTPPPNVPSVTPLAPAAVAADPGQPAEQANPARDPFSLLPGTERTSAAETSAAAAPAAGPPASAPATPEQPPRFNPPTAGEMSQSPVRVEGTQPEKTAVSDREGKSAAGLTGSAPLQPSASLLERGVSGVNPAAYQGQRLTLLDAIRQTRETSEQLSIVKTYWQLAVAIAGEHFAEEEISLLERTAEPQIEHERALLAAAKSAATAHSQEAKLAIVTAQWDLLELSRVKMTGAMPWPGDLPLLGAYRTHFETLFRERAAPAGLQRIHELLPWVLQAIGRRAESACAAQDAVTAVFKAHQQGHVPLRSFLEAVEQQRNEQEAYLANVVQYNHRIAEYALAVVGPTADPSTVVATLIKQQDASAIASRETDRDVRQASAAEPVTSETGSARPQGEVAPATIPLRSPPAQDTAQATYSVLKSIRVVHQ